jgi:putative ABC transport system substrate-binding protein
MRVSRAGRILTVVLGLLAAPLAAEAQPTGRMARIGFLYPASAPAAISYLAAFLEGLRDLGHIEGRDFTLESRFAEGSAGRLPDLAAELVRLKVDVILTDGTPAATAAKRATPTIPIVMASGGDPVGAGLVASLARPGGNVTGVTTLAGDLSAKRLQLLKEAVPKVSRVALLQNPANPFSAIAVQETASAARSLSVRVQVLGVKGPGEFEGAFGAMTKGRAGALLVVPDMMLSDNGRRLADLAVKHRLPTMFGRGETELGGLMAYGPDLLDLFRRAAVYVDKILKGVSPAVLPIEEPRRVELIINLKTAKALGLTIPPSILIRADQVIQ